MFREFQVVTLQGEAAAAPIERMCRLGDLRSALKLWKSSGLPLGRFDAAIQAGAVLMVTAGRANELLSLKRKYAFRLAISDVELVRTVYERQNYSTFLEEVWRLPDREAFRSEVVDAIRRVYKQGNPSFPLREIHRWQLKSELSDIVRDAVESLRMKNRHEFMVWMERFGMN